MNQVIKAITTMSVVFLLAGICHAGAVDLPRTGQTVCADKDGAVITCAGTGQDGEKKAGNPWPQPRFTDNLNGTVTDNLTGLVWLRNANCFGKQSWNNAMTSAAGLAGGACGLADNSKAGEWRIPNINELRSLVDFSKNSPALIAGHPFLNVVNGVSSDDYYYSSSTYTLDSNFPLVLYLGNGTEFNPINNGWGKNGVYGYGWPVR